MHDRERLEEAAKLLINAIPEERREGLRETPRRFADAWIHYTSGYGVDPATVLKMFEDGAEDCDQMVVQGPISLWSLCEHHMAPFFGAAYIAYIPNKRIVGLSKMVRLLDIFARRLQVQERLTNQIANAIDEILEPTGVGVILRCRHTCMEMRGVERIGSITTTSALRGAILHEPDARSEFLEFVKLSGDGSLI